MCLLTCSGLTGQVHLQMSKALACGDVGTGAMADGHTVLQAVKSKLDTALSACDLAADSLS